MQHKDNLLRQYKYVTYLIGAMEKTSEGDDGSSKREKIEKELLCRGVYPINPVTLEKMKTGMTTNKAKEYMQQCLDNNNLSDFKNISREIWKGIDKLDVKTGLIHIPGDIDYVIMSDFIVCLYQKGDAPCGTFFELGIALEHDIPVYLLTDANMQELKKSFLQGVYASGGMVFNEMGSLLNFLENEYKLKKE